jgi:hypothetical protein
VHATQVTSSTWDQQNDVAHRIARRNLAALAVEVTPEEMPRLAAFFREPPRRLAPDELPLGELLRASASALARSPRVASDDARRIRRRAFDKLAVSYATPHAALGLVGLVARDPAWALAWLRRRLRR